MSIDELGFMDDTEKDLQESLAEQEKKRKELLELEGKLKKFKQLQDLELWDEVVDEVKGMIYDNLMKHPTDSDNTYYYDRVWGLKCFIEVVKQHSVRYEEVCKELSE